MKSKENGLLKSHNPGIEVQSNSPEIYGYFNTGWILRYTDTLLPGIMPLLLPADPRILAPCHFPVPGIFVPTQLSTDIDKPHKFNRLC